MCSLWDKSFIWFEFRVLFGLADLAAAISSANKPASESADLAVPLWEDVLECAKCNYAAPPGGMPKHLLKFTKFTVWFYNSGKEFWLILHRLGCRFGTKLGQKGDMADTFSEPRKLLSSFYLLPPHVWFGGLLHWMPFLMQPPKYLCLFLGIFCLLWNWKKRL